MIAFLPVFFPVGCAAILVMLSKYMPKSAKFLGFAGTSLAFVSIFTLYNLISAQAVQIINAPDVFALTIAAFSAFYAALAAISSAWEEKSPWFFFNLLISTAFALGAALADNFLLMLFFWEGLLATLYFFLLPYNSKTALKAFLINAAGDIILLVGICLFYVKTGGLNFNEAYLTNLSGAGYWALIFIFTGTVAKAGAFPFHSWIAPAAQDAPFSFSAMLPAAIEKLLAVFLLGKIFTVLFPIMPAGARVYFCCLGVVTAVIAMVKMLSFKDLKQLLAYSIILQIGLLIIGMGAKDMLAPMEDITYIANHGIFKAALLACAFFAAGHLHYAFGSTALGGLKGAARKEPLTTVILLICALGLAGASPVDLLFIPNAVAADAFAAMPLLALVPALAGIVTVFTFGKVFYEMFKKGNPPKKQALAFRVAAIAAFAPVLFFTCGFEFSIEHFLAPHFAGFHVNFISLTSIIILAAGAILAAKVNLPSYEVKADTFEIVRAGISALASILFAIDRFMDKLIDVWPSKITKGVSLWIMDSHRGNIPQYIIWAVLGIIIFIILAAKGGMQ
jgi:formate hydrogenlyase subunit 3/multisubunit Na+/H+ antiporter MnhD subunit